MKDTKRLLSFAFAFLLFLPFVACSSSNTNSNTTGPMQTPSPVGKTLQIYRGNGVDPVFSIAWSPSGQRLAMRVAQMPAETGAVRPAVFYLTEWGGVQTSLHPQSLMRYDLTSGKTTSLLYFPYNAMGYIPQIQLSPDNRWLLIESTEVMNGKTSITRLQLMRTDGTQMQTFACFSDTGEIDWMPDGQQVAFTRGQYDQRQKEWLYTVDVLNLATGKTHAVLSGDYFPDGWLDDHRLIVGKETGVDTTPGKIDIYLLDTNKGSQQNLNKLPHIASFALWGGPGSLEEGDVVVSSDSSQVFISSFSQSNAIGCQGTSGTGPSTLKSYVIKEGSTHVIYSSKSLAIQSILPVSNGTLLMYIENNVGDLSQNGLWKMNSDGTGLTRLTTANDPKCRDLNYAVWAPQIANNDQSYALLQTDFHHDASQSIVVGKLAGGTPTTIATGAQVSPPAGKPGFDRFLQLVGMV